MSPNSKKDVMDCEHWTLDAIEILIPFASLMTVVSLYFVEKHKAKSNEWWSSLLGYLALFVSGAYVTEKGKPWRITFIISISCIVICTLFIANTGSGKCLY